MQSDEIAISGFKVLIDQATTKQPIFCRLALQ